MRAEGRLGEGSLLEAVKMERCADVVTMLALLCEVPMPLVQSLLQKGHREAVLIPWKAAALSWRTVRTILASRTIGLPMSVQDLEAAHNDSIKLSPSNAQRVLRFWQVRHSVGKNGAAAVLEAEAASPSG